MIFAELWDDDMEMVYVSLYERHGGDNHFFANLVFPSVSIIRRDHYVAIRCFAAGFGNPCIEVAEVRDCRGRSGPDELADAPWIFPLDGEASE